MISQLNADGLSAINSSKGLDFSNIGKAVAQQTAMHGYGAISDTDIGKVVTTAHDISQTIKAFAYFDIKEDAKHGAFAVFRDAMAEKAENYTKGIIPDVKDVANGDSYTNFYSDILSAQRTFENELLTSSPNSIEAQLDYSNVDWNSFASRMRYLDKIQDYAKNTALRDHAGMVGNSLNAKQLQASAMEIKVLFHTSSPEEYKKYINTFEHAIHNNYQQELKNAQEQARALGYTGGLSNVKAMEKFKETLPAGSQGVMSNLIEMTNGNINKVDRYILARIHNGDIDIQKVLSTGELNGVKLDEASLKAFAALNVFAHTDAIATEYQNNILKGIGYESKLKNVDLNNIKDVTARIQEFEKALEKAGYSAVDLQKSSLLGSAEKNVTKGVPLSKLSLDQLRKIDLKGIKDESVKKALAQYINLKEHAQTLKAAKMLKGKLISRGISLIRKVLGDSDLSQGIGQIYSQINNVKTAIKVGQRVVKFAKWMKGTKLAKGLKAAARFQHKINQKALKKILGKRYDAFNRSRFGDKGKQIRNRAKSIKKAKQQAQRTKLKEAKKAAKKLTKKGQKHAAKLAKKTQSKLFGKVGKQAGKWARSAGNLAAHGAAGTTGAGVGTAGASTGAGASTSAGAGAAGGTSFFVIVFWVILIALIISAICNVFSSIFVAMGESAKELDQSLIGDILNWFAEFEWPWTVTEEDRRNVVTYTITKLQETEAQSKHAGTHLKGKSFRGGLAPSTPDTYNAQNPKYITNDDKPDKIGWVRRRYNASNITDEMTYYVYKNRETGEPINEYTTIKLCMAMAHVYTYQIEKKHHIEEFTTYTIGLWNYINQHTVTALLTMCDGSNQGCGNFSYKCITETEDSALYTEGSGWGGVRFTKPGDKIEITTREPHHLYVTGGDYVNQNSAGCMRTVHNNKTGEVSEIDKIGRGRGTTYRAAIYNLSTLSEKYRNIMSQFSHKNTSYIGDESGNPVSWAVDPSGVQQCINELAGTVDSPFFNTLLNSVSVFCPTSTSPIAGCSNQDIKDVYTKKIETKYCGTSYMLNTASGQKQQVYLTNESMCKSQHTHQKLPGGNYYKCNGHSTSVYCKGYGKITYYTECIKNGFVYVGINPVTVQHASYASCGCESEKTLQVYRSSVSFKKTSKVTLYICNGHNNHGTFNENSGYVDSCDNKTFMGYLYQCTGYKQTTYVKSSIKLYVCKGHMECHQHDYCPGHTLTYCQGHIDYKVTRNSLLDSSEQIYSDSWTTTIEEKYLWFVTVKTTYSPKVKPNNGHTSLAREGWKGWNKDNKEQMRTTANEDWYLKYGIGLGSLVGGQCSPYEKFKILETFDIRPEKVSEKLWENVNFALDNCGKVAYYPEDKAVTGGLSGNNFGTAAPVVWDKNRVQRGVHGLDPQYFADWVYRSTHDNNSSNYLVSYYAGNGHQVTATTSPGTPIVNNTPGNIRTGILLGVFTDDSGVSKIRYVGIDAGTTTGGGWITVLTEPISGWKYTTATCS